MGQPFEFMTLLDFLSLTGMLIKNSIVLIDEINIQIASGKDPFTAIVDSGVSRVRPLSMAAMTTVLGMIPLLTGNRLDRLGFIEGSVTEALLYW